MYKEIYPVTYYFYPLLKENIGESSSRNDFLKSLDVATNQDTEALLYIHIPFCHDLCRFCPFHVKVSSGTEVYYKYTKALIKEIKMLADKNRICSLKYKAIYFGGGSPSIFPLDAIKDIFDTIFHEFTLCPDIEISFEGEPRTLGNMELQSLLKSFGVSRISFGLQTFDENLRSKFNIVATLDDVYRCTSNAKAHQFSDINVDMMYDLPGQTIDMLEEDIKLLGACDFDSVDYYNLHYFAFPQKFKLMMKKGEVPPKPTDKMHFALSEQLRAGMIKLGYHHVADQIFSKHKELSKYFQLLWGGGNGSYTAETIAVGSSARGYINGYSYMNYANVNKYMESIERNELPIEKKSDQLLCQENRGAAFLMKLYGIEGENMHVLRALPNNLLSKWIQEGFVYKNKYGVYITERGKNWTTNMMFDALEPEQQVLALKSLSHILEKPGSRTGSF